MNNFSNDDQGPPLTNAVQVIVLNVVVTLSLALSLTLALSWSLIAALFVGWVGGSMLTLTLLLAAYAFSTRKSVVVRPMADRGEPADLARASEIWMWEEDAADDQWQSLAARPAADIHADEMQQSVRRHKQS